MLATYNPVQQYQGANIGFLVHRTSMKNTDNCKTIIIKACHSPLVWNT